MFTNSSHAVSILLHVWDVDVLDGHHWTVWCVHGSAVYSDGKGCNGMLHSIYDNCQENKIVFQILKIYNPVTRDNFLLSFWTWTMFLFSLKQGFEYKGYWNLISARFAETEKFWSTFLRKKMSVKFFQSRRILLRLTDTHWIILLSLDIVLGIFFFSSFIPIKSYFCTIFL